MQFARLSGARLVILSILRWAIDIFCIIYLTIILIITYLEPFLSTTCKQKYRTGRTIFGFKPGPQIRVFFKSTLILFSLADDASIDDDKIINKIYPGKCISINIFKYCLNFIKLYHSNRESNNLKTSVFAPCLRHQLPSNTCQDTVMTASSVY